MKYCTQEMTTEIGGDLDHLGMIVQHLSIAKQLIVVRHYQSYIASIVVKLSHRLSRPIAQLHFVSFAR